MDNPRMLRSIKNTAALLILLTTLFAPAKGWAEENRPNILVIRSDDLARWAVGYYGNREVRTPNIDRFHREGAAFLNAFVTTPVCSPSRMGFLTGLYSVQTSVTDWISDDSNGLNADYVTLPQVFQQNGYATGLIGKWHLGYAPQYFPTHHGFDEFVGILSGTNHWEPTVNVNGTQRTLKGVWLGDFLTDRAADFLRAYRDKPFFLMLDYHAPHTPHSPNPPEDEKLYANLDPAIPAWPGLDRKKCEQLTKDYYAQVSGLDRNIGKILTLLEELNLPDKTIVIFTSDNGYLIGHHGLAEKGSGVRIDVPDGTSAKDRRRPNMFDEVIRVPLAIRWPGHIKPGITIDAPVTQLDFYPTLLAMGGLKCPPLPKSQAIQGADFSPLLRGEALPWREHVFGAYDITRVRPARLRMIRTPKWKLVKHYDEAKGEDELYDLEHDPGELRNLLEDSPKPVIRDRLERDLIEWQRSVNDPMLNSADFQRRQADYLK
ncbi:sulfatase-like hydrolase/transferase [Candidatus Sumerlaeota bacterium]|nr:sulfatase-like hydrolase/transferase [Candidatus Sumerlaeota bacterium]